MFTQINIREIRQNLPRSISFDDKMAIKHGINAAAIYAVFEHFTTAQLNGQILPGRLTSLDKNGVIWLRLSSGELGLVLNLSKSSASKALKTLRDGGLLRSEKRPNESSFDHTLWHACEFQFSRESL